MQSQEAFTRRDPGELAPTADGSTLARGLGLFSLGLGITELAAPRALAQAIGIDPDGRTSTVLRAFGMREIVSGLGVLVQPKRALPLWARLAGDALDLAFIGWAAKSKRTSTQRMLAAVAAVAGVAALDAIAGRRVARANRAVVDPVIFSVTINKPVAEVYAFWRRFENLPRFMDYLESVTERSGVRSHWVAKLPLGGTITWDAEIIDDRPNELIAWRTIEGSLLAHRGEVTFARTPGRDMTEVRVQLELGILGTKPSPALAKLITKPQIKGDLRRFKQVMETGEVMRSDASIHRGRHPAQPPEEAPALPPSLPTSAASTTPRSSTSPAASASASKPSATQEPSVPSSTSTAPGTTGKGRLP